MGKGLQFSSVLWKDLTEKEVFEQTLEFMEECAMQLWTGRTASTKVLR